MYSVQTMKAFVQLIGSLLMLAAGAFLLYVGVLAVIAIVHMVNTGQIH